MKNLFLKIIIFILFVLNISCEEDNEESYAVKFKLNEKKYAFTGGLADKRQDGFYFMSLFGFSSNLDKQIIINYKENQLGYYTFEDTIAFYISLNPEFYVSSNWTRNVVYAGLGESANLTITYEDSLRI